MDSLFLQNEINANQFSILMAYDPSEESLITFGGIPDFVDSVDKSISHRVAGDDHWSLKLNGLKVGDKAIMPKVKLALTDTGTSLIYFDSQDFKAVMDELCKDFTCEEKDSEAGVFSIRDCNVADLPTVWVHLDLHEYQIAP